MTRPNTRIINVETGESIQREMNDEEFVNYQEFLTVQAAAQVEAEAKTQEKAAVLAQLGITEEQAKLLLS